MTQELTQGQKLVGLTFNPSGDPKVTEIKQKFADAVDALYLLQNSANSREQFVFAQEAISQIISAQMWTIKALTWKD